MPMRGYIGLGGNLGDREKFLAAARAGLERRGVRILSSSSVYETAPVDCPGGRFLNQALEFRFSGGPEELLEIAREVESENGRDRSVPGAAGHRPRTVDIDLLLVPGEKRNTARLTLPHPGLWKRRFVLAPLAEIAPALRNPDGERTIGEELERLPAGEVRLYNPHPRKQERAGR